MAQLRSTAQRKADVVTMLQKNGDLWLATASSSGKPHLIAASSWWDGNQLVIATTSRSRTARNLESTGIGRLALGAPDDVVLVDVQLAEIMPVASAKPELKSGFVAAAGWDPADEGDDWKFFRLRPLQIQAYRGYGELQGREVMRKSQWLA